MRLGVDKAGNEKVALVVEHQVVEREVAEENGGSMQLRESLHDACTAPNSELRRLQF